MADAPADALGAGEDGAHDDGAGEDSFDVPELHQQYPSKEEAVQAARQYAEDNGFAIVIRNSNGKKVHFICDRGRQPDPRNLQPDASRRRPGSGSRLTGCPYAIFVQFDGTAWTVTSEGACARHNHARATALEAHPTLRHLSEAQEGRIAELQRTGVKATVI